MNRPYGKLIGLLVLKIVAALLLAYTALVIGVLGECGIGLTTNGAGVARWPIVAFVIAGMTLGLIALILAVIVLLFVRWEKRNE